MATAAADAETVQKTASPHRFSDLGSSPDSALLLSSRTAATVGVLPQGRESKIDSSFIP
jgi:hypothetical protein